MSLEYANEQIEGFIAAHRAGSLPIESVLNGIDQWTKSMRALIESHHAEI